MGLLSTTTAEANLLLEGRLCRQGMMIINLEIARAAVRVWFHARRRDVADLQMATVTRRGGIVSVTGGLTVWLAAPVRTADANLNVVAATFDWFDLFRHPPEIETLVQQRLDNALAASRAGH